MMNLTTKQLKRRANILYRLRRKGFCANTKERLVFYPAGGMPYSILQIQQIASEFNFNVQFEI